MDLVDQVALDTDEIALGVEEAVGDGLGYIVRDELGVNANARTVRYLLLVSFGRLQLTLNTKSIQPPITPARPLPPAAPTRRTSQFFLGMDCSADVQYLESTKSKAFESTSLEGIKAIPADPAKLQSAWLGCPRT